MPFFLLPLIAAALQATSSLVDKSILTIRRVTYQQYVGVSFPLIFAVTLTIFLIMRPPLDTNLLYGQMGLLLGFSILMQIGGNIIYYRALKNDHITELESISLLASVPIIISTAILFADERKLTLVIPALIAAAAVYWAHVERHHLIIAPHTRPYVIWVLIIPAFMAAVSKILLASWHPVALETIRSTVTSMVFVTLFAQSIRKTPFRAIPKLVITNILTTVAWLLYYTGYKYLGVVHTLLLFSIQPLLVYFGAMIFLNEKPERKKITAFLIVLITIAVSQVLQSQG